MHAAEAPLPPPLQGLERQLGRPQERTNPWHNGHRREIEPLPEQVVVNGVRDRAGEEIDIRHDLGALPLLVEVIQCAQVLAEL